MEYAISIGGPRRRGIQDDVELVRAAEGLGIDYAFAAEAWGRDAVTPLAYLAACTELGATVAAGLAHGGI